MKQKTWEQLSFDHVYHLCSNSVILTSLTF